MSILPLPEHNYVDVLVRACNYATRSPDPSTQNAAVLCKGVRGLSPIAATWAVNEFPKGVQYADERWQRPQKYDYVEHAERNSIYHAAAHGIPTYGLTMVSPWAACADCARGIIQTGVHRLVTLSTDASHTSWNDSISVAMTMLDEAGVEVVYVDGPVMMEGFTLLRNGQPFTP
jgi:dCMP deaminase